MASPLQLLVSPSVVVMWAMRTLIFFFKHRLIMVAKKNNLMWEPYGPSFCLLLCSQELTYSEAFDPQIFIKISTLLLCEPLFLTLRWKRSGMRHGFCPWRMNSLSVETHTAQMESFTLQPKWEHDLLELCYLCDQEESGKALRRMWCWVWQ